jgi:hypothetical protein
MSSIWDGSMPARLMASCIVKHAIRAAWLSRSDPPNAPMAVRHAAAITTSFIVLSLPVIW